MPWLTDAMASGLISVQELLFIVHPPLAGTYQMAVLAGTCLIVCG
jgi:hypothetical protein